MQHVQSPKRPPFLKRFWNAIRPPADFSAIILGGILGNVIDTVIHETGHALAAFSFGYNMVSFQIGSGDAIAALKVSGIDFILQENFVFGGGRIIVPDIAINLSSLLMVFAGPLFPLIVAAVVMAFLWGSTKIWLPLSVMSASFMFLVGALSNLAPGSPKSDGTKIYTIIGAYLPDYLTGIPQGIMHGAVLIVLFFGYGLFILLYNNSLHNARYEAEKVRKDALKKDEPNLDFLS